MTHAEREAHVNQIKSITYGLRTFQNQTVVDACKDIERLLHEIMIDDMVKHRGVDYQNPYKELTK